MIDPKTIDYTRGRISRQETRDIALPCGNILCIPAHIAPHEFLLAQHLAVEEPHRGDKVKQQDPIREDQELAQEDEGKFGVDRPAA